MLQEKSSRGAASDSTTSPKKKVRRILKAPFMRKVVAYADKHTVDLAAKKYGVVNSVIYGWRKRLAGPANQRNAPRAPARVNRSVYLLARKLRTEVAKRIRDTGDIEDLEMYALMLTKAVLNDS